MEGMKFNELISSAPMRTSQVFRYSNTRLTDKESLSDHIVDVQMMGYAILKTLNNVYGEDVNSGIFLEKCILHDLDEVLTGDIPRTTKYYNPTILKEAQDVAEHAANQLFVEFFKDDKLIDTWRNCKQGKEGILLKLVDIMCVASKSLKEVDILGNNYFLKVVGEVITYMGELVKYLDEKSPYNEGATGYLKSLLLEAICELERLLDDHKEVATRYGIITSRLM